MIILKIRVKQNDFTPQIKRLLGAIDGNGRRNVLRAGGYEFWKIARANLGISGVDRPRVWSPLSYSYIKQLREKSFGTPLVPTLLRTGTLLNSIRILTENNYCEVFTNCDYAPDHQFGVPSRRLPPRPYFPVYGNGQLTPYAEAKMILAMETEIMRQVL